MPKLLYSPYGSLWAENAHAEHTLFNMNFILVHKLLCCRERHPSKRTLYYMELGRAETARHSMGYLARWTAFPWCTSPCVSEAQRKSELSEYDNVPPLIGYLWKDRDAQEQRSYEFLPSVSFATTLSHIHGMYLQATHYHSWSQI